MAGVVVRVSAVLNKRVTRYKGDYDHFEVPPSPESPGMRMRSVRAGQQLMASVHVASTGDAR